MHMNNNYYVMLNERQKPKFDAHIEGVLVDKNKEPIPIIFNKGRSIKNKDEEFYIVQDEGDSEIGKLRDKLSVIVNNSNSLFVLSNNLCLLLEEIAPKQIEFFNLHILNENEIISNYKIGNIVHKINCIDYNISELEFEFYDDNDEPDGDILATQALVLDEELIPSSVNIFLLDKYKEDVIIVSAYIKNAIENKGITGSVFCRLEMFKN
jgi:hypothetical protein